MVLGALTIYSRRLHDVVKAPFEVVEMGTEIRSC
jgi:hypothetical protein